MLDKQPIHSRRRSDQRPIISETACGHWSVNKTDRRGLSTVGSIILSFLLELSPFWQKKLRKLARTKTRKNFAVNCQNFFQTPRPYCYWLMSEKVGIKSVGDIHTCFSGGVPSISRKQIAPRRTKNTPDIGQAFFHHSQLHGGELRSAR